MATFSSHQSNYQPSPNFNSINKDTKKKAPRPKTNSRLHTKWPLEQGALKSTSQTHTPQLNHQQAPSHTHTTSHQPTFGSSTPTKTNKHTQRRVVGRRSNKSSRTRDESQRIAGQAYSRAYNTPFKSSRLQAISVCHSFLAIRTRARHTLPHAMHPKPSQI